MYASVLRFSSFTLNLKFLIVLTACGVIVDSISLFRYYSISTFVYRILLYTLHYLSLLYQYNYFSRFSACPCRPISCCYMVIVFAATSGAFVFAFSTQTYRYNWTDTDYVAHWIALYGSGLYPHEIYQCQIRKLKGAPQNYCHFMRICTNYMK